MTPEEAIRLIEIISLFDNRKIGDDETAADRAEAWADLLADVSMRDAVAAVKHHFATTSDPRAYLMPAHILEYAKKLRIERVAAFNKAADIPDRIALSITADPRDVHAYQAERKLLHALVAAGEVTPEMGQDQIAAVVRRHQGRELTTGGAA